MSISITSKLADIAFALWVVFVGVVYYGAPLSPGLWVYEPKLLTVYGAMLIVSAAMVCLRWLLRTPAAQDAKAPTRPRS
jgi:hypothetical protein